MGDSGAPPTARGPEGEQWLEFRGLNGPIVFQGSDQVLQDFRRVAPGWQCARVPAGVQAPLIQVRSGSERCRVSAHPDFNLSPAAYRGRLAAVNGLVADLLVAYLHAHPGEIGLHAAGVALNGRVIALSGLTESGKSTLAVRLAALGAKVFTDDALPVSMATGAAVGLGVPPRLHLPLPRDKTATLRQFVRGRLVLRARRYAYVALPPGRLASFGEQAPLGAIVLLRRQSSGPTRVAPAAAAAVLTHLIRQSFSSPAPAEVVLRHWRRMVDQVPCFTLTYADGDDAAARIAEAFAGRAAA